MWWKIRRSATKTQLTPHWGESPHSKIVDLLRVLSLIYKSTKAPTLLIGKIIHFSLETEEIGIHNPVFPANLPCCLLLVACPPFCLFQPLQLLQRLSGSLIQEQSESSSNRSLSSKENLSFSFSQSNIKSIISARLRSSSLNDSELFVPSAALRQRFWTLFYRFATSIFMENDLSSRLVYLCIVNLYIAEDKTTNFWSNLV